MEPKSTVLQTLVTVGIVCLCNVRETFAQISNPVMAIEGTPAELTITIPNSQLVMDSAYISIRLDNGTNVTDILYLVGSSPKVRDEYVKKLTATQVDRKVTIQFPSATAEFAGMFRCYSHASSTPIADCRQLLVIIRKPSAPVVRALSSSSAVVGSRLELMCEAHSTSLPVNHGLASDIWWFDENGQSFGQTSNDPRVRVNMQNQLVLEPLARADKGRKFYCITADSTGDANKRLPSDKSGLFEVTPEYEPSIEDFQLDPAFKNNHVVEKKIGETISFRCDADCWPVCNITWMFRSSGGPSEFQPVAGLTDRKMLAVNVARSSEGRYECKAENKHGAAQVGFQLDILYLEAPLVAINNEDKSTTRIVEDTPASLTCVFDGNPGPVVNWLSPSRTMLSTQKASGPNIVLEAGLRKQLYTSTHVLNRLKCEDTGIYKCEGNNNINTAEGRIELVVTCPPSSADVAGLELKQDYFWEISQQLSFQFVIRAFPEPNMTQIISSLNGIMRKEEIPRDIEIVKEVNFDGKAYLTRFGLTSKRKLDQSDTDRTYTMTLQSSDFVKDFVFHIHPRGPPHIVLNLTAIDVRHDSLVLLWLPGFNGGENQTFSVEYRPYSPQESGSLPTEHYKWTTGLEKIPDQPYGLWVEVTVGPLDSSTDYVVRVQAINILGSSVSEIRVQTAASPKESMGGGAIAGIVFGVLFILVIVAVVIYLLVIKKQCRKGRSQPGSTRENYLLKELKRFHRNVKFSEQIVSLFRRDKDHQKQGHSGIATSNGSTPKESHWAKVRKMLKRDSPGSNYHNVPAKDYNNPVAGDDEYEDEIISGQHNRKPRSPTGQQSGFNNNAPVHMTPESGRRLNEQGLVYVEVEFLKDKNKAKKGKKTQGKKKNAAVHKSNESVNYSDIDFSKTAEKRREMEEAEGRTQVQPGEDESENGEYENTEWQKRYPDAGFGIGTTV